jgi:hypothetical protein
MSQGVRLIPLLCSRCQTPVPAKPDEVAWVCEQCGQGLLLNEEKGAVPQDIFFSTAIAQNGSGWPYWVSRAQVTITKRETYSGNQMKAAMAFWATAHLFFVHASRQSIDEIVSTGVKLLRNPVGMQAGGRTRLSPVVLPPGDLRALAEFMVMSIEADRSDAMRELQFKLDIDPPQLWVLP